MGKQTVSITFEGDTMQDMVMQILSFLDSINVLKQKEAEPVDKAGKD